MFFGRWYSKTAKVWFLVQICSLSLEKIILYSNRIMKLFKRYFKETIKGDIFNICYHLYPFGDVKKSKSVSFLPCGVYSGWIIFVTLLIYVYTSVRKNFWFQMIFLAFWHHHISSSWLSLKFLKKSDFLGGPRPRFWQFFLIYKGLLGACCKSGDLCWHGFVCRFWNYIVLCPDVVFIFSKKVFVGPTD